jgi:hypothetical protein
VRRAAAPEPALTPCDLPFTFSHPAAVLPFARTKLCFSALVVGSLSPDFLYFLVLAPRGGFGHRLPGLFLFCLPASLCVLYVFHRLIKRPAAELLPDYVRLRVEPQLERFTFLPASRLALVVASALLGALTHVGWDAFTHEGGWGVVHFPALGGGVVLPRAGTVPVYSLLQHASTLLGAAVLTAAATRWLRGRPGGDGAVPMNRRARYGAVCALLGSSAMAGLGYGAWKAGGQEGAAAWEAFAGYGVVCGITVLFVLLTLYGAVRQHRMGAGERPVL